MTKIVFQQINCVTFCVLAKASDRSSGDFVHLQISFRLTKVESEARIRVLNDWRRWAYISDCEHSRLVRSGLQLTRTIRRSIGGQQQRCNALSEQRKPEER